MCVSVPESAVEKTDGARAACVCACVCVVCVVNGETVCVCAESGETVCVCVESGETVCVCSCVRVGARVSGRGRQGGSERASE